MKNINVLIIGSDLSVKGGITTVINNFLGNKWGCINVELLPTYIDGSAFRKILFFIKSIFKYIILLLKNSFDIAHIHMSYNGSFFRKLFIVILSKIFNKRVVLHLHGSEFEKFYNKSNRCVKMLIKYIFNRSDVTIVLGENWKRIIKAITDKCNVIVLNNSVKIPIDKVNRDSDTVNILFLGVLIKRKGIYDLVESIRILNEKGVIKDKKLKFVIGGSGEEQEKIKKKIKEYELEYCIDMLGWINKEAKESLLKQSQIFVLPSYNEGLPMAILEAMSYGIPVISTNVGSINEVVEDGKNGYLINPGNEKLLAEYIEKIVSDSKVWEEMSRESKSKIANNFNEEKYFHNMQLIYNNLIEKENIVKEN